MRHISFFLTQNQIRNRSKRVTRRNGWRWAKPRQILLGIVKGQGLAKGEKVEPLAIIEVVTARFERLDRMISDPAYGAQEVILEGFPEMTAEEFVAMYCDHNGCTPDEEITRIEFKYRKIFPSPKKEPTMAAKKDKSTTKPKPGAEPVDTKGDKDAIDQSFANSPKPPKAGKGKGKERPGVDSDPDFDGDGKPPADSAATQTAAVRMPAVKTYVHELDPQEQLPTFQKIVFVEFSEKEFAEKGKTLAAFDGEIAVLEAQMKQVVGEWKEKITGVETQRKTLSAQINSKGHEQEIECRKRVNEVTGMATIFNARTLEIIEERKLTDAELQQELQFQNSTKGSKRIVKGGWPEGKTVGATAKEDPEKDAANEAAMKALADESAAG